MNRSSLFVLVAIPLLFSGLQGTVLADTDNSHIQRGEAFYAEGEFNESLVEFNLVGDTGSFDAVYARGKSLIELGRYREAIAEFTKALELKKVCARAHYHRGRSHAALKDFGKAVEDFDQAIAIRSGYDKAFFARGEVKLELHDFSGARSDMQSASLLGNMDASQWLAEHPDVK